MTPKQPKMSAKTPLKTIRSGSLSRGIALAKMTFSAGAQAASHAVGGFFSEEAEKGDRSQALLLSQLTLLAESLGELKGSLMKVGQMLSVYGEHFLPPEANAVLKSLQSDSPPLEWSAIEKVLRRRFKPEQLARLRIEPQALASASLGQVHRAKLDSGREIVLKIQYPGVEKAIESDIKALRSILSMSKLIPGGHKYDELFKEVREMLHREVDYCKELEATLEYREFLKRDPRYIVAEPLPEFSGRKILASTYEEGCPVDSPEVGALSQERRNALGVAVFELLLKELFELRKMQTDPHFGNYRIRIGDPLKGVPDQLILFDFGAMRDVPASFLRGYRLMLQGGVKEKRELVEKGAKLMGLLQEGDSEVARKRFSDLVMVIMEPSRRKRPYAWGKSDLPSQVIREGRKLAFDFKLRPPPRELVFIDRKMAGVFIFLSVLKAEFDPGPMVEHYLERESRELA